MLGVDEVVIDAFTHFLPSGYVRILRGLRSAAHLEPLIDRFSRIEPLCDIDARLTLIAPFPSLRQVLSLALPTPEMVPDGADSAIAAQAGNDGLAEIVASRRDRFPAFLASLPLNDTDNALKEMERAATQLGARGFQILTSVNGLPLDHISFFPVFQYAVELDLPIFIHPYKSDQIADYPSEKRSAFEITNILGWPHETSVAMTRLVFSEVLSKLPTLKLVAHHLGGTVPYLAGRIGPMWDQLGLRSGKADDVKLRKRLSRSPIELFKSFYADTAVADTNALRCGVPFFGPTRILFASDAPFGPKAGQTFLDLNLNAIAELQLSPSERQMIIKTNAQYLLKI